MYENIIFKEDILTNDFSKYESNGQTYFETLKY